ncbi:MAG: M23 family metallopeptidase [Verrucomicrobiae bacterium]|nr:M23 family metallopeptidase [Verrucomicrobiae bacterium]
MLKYFLGTLAGLAGATLSLAQPFQLPTANHALYDADGGGARFFVPTVGKPWPSGSFGCVRTGGWQLHEGLDIRCRQRDGKGEPIDPVLATADGTVVYLNRKPALSNYGNYLVIRHLVEGLEIYSLYAHLREIRKDLVIGNEVKSGETIAIMGRTANTREGISKERAHVHFELNVMLNDHFAAWHQQHAPKQRNDHGQWNGQNLLGLDPQAVLLEQRKLGTNFNLVRWLQQQPELCRVLVRKTDFPWLHRYAALVQPSAAADPQDVAGYELKLNFMGIPIAATPRPAAEIKSQAAVQLLSVNRVEYRQNPCRRLVTQRQDRWELTQRGLDLISLLTY